MSKTGLTSNLKTMSLAALRALLQKHAHLVVLPAAVDEDHRTLRAEGPSHAANGCLGTIAAQDRPSRPRPRQC